MGLTVAWPSMRAVWSASVVTSGVGRWPRWALAVALITVVFALHGVGACSGTSQHVAGHEAAAEQLHHGVPTTGGGGAAYLELAGGGLADSAPIGHGIEQHVMLACLVALVGGATAAGLLLVIKWVGRSIAPIRALVWSRAPVPPRSVTFHSRLRIALCVIRV